MLPCVPALEADPADPDRCAQDGIFPDRTRAVAVVDRLVHRATILELNAESYRRSEAIRASRRKAGRQSLIWCTLSFARRPVDANDILTRFRIEATGSEQFSSSNISSQFTERPDSELRNTNASPSAILSCINEGLTYRTT